MSETSAKADLPMRWAIDPDAAAMMGTDELRANFLVEDIFAPGEIRLTYTQYDRMVLGGAMPKGAPIELGPAKQTGTKGFLDRRELIAFNIGGSGTVTVDGEALAAGSRDMVYAGMGSTVSFASDDPAAPAKFYLLSAPAHAAHPARLIRIDDAKRLDLGSAETCNERSIFQFIHADSPARTCQLVAGMTTFAPGSVWNTMPAHLHDRRMEAYLYFDLPPTARAFHMMGEPTETRHLVVANEQAVISPAWSIHAGVGTASYTFIWAMAGDNVDYTDVEPVPVETLR